MLAPWWFAVLGQPVFVLPLPQAADTPAAVAVAAGRVPLRRTCRSLRCLQAGWELPIASRAVAGARRSPFALPRALPGTPSFGLRAPATRRDWVATEGHNWRVGARYGVEAIREADTRLRVEFGGGYRLEPYVEDGTAATGPVARGRIDLVQHLGTRALLRQQLQVESGRNDTFVRNALAVDVFLQPRWTLRSRVEVRRDSEAADTATVGTLQLRYTF